MKKRLRIAALLILMLALACAHPQQAEAPDTPAPAEQTDPVDVVATPVSDMVSYEATPEPLVPTPTPTPTPVPTPTPTPTPAPLEGVTIGLDPGHQQRANFSTEPIAPGEKTEKAKCSSGTRGIVTGVYEYEVNLKVALKLRRLLEQNGATVVLTRTTNNVNLSNRSRAEYFNDREVDLAILLYCNGADDTGIRGAFMLLPTKERTSFFSENAALACLEVSPAVAVQSKTLYPRSSAPLRFRRIQRGSQRVLSVPPGKRSRSHFFPMIPSTLSERISMPRR